MKKQSAFLESLFDLSRLLGLILLMLLVVFLFLFSIKFDAKHYDIVVSSRLSSGTYYGIEYSPALELWKIERSEDGSLYTRRLFPR